jgi:hypothetical protein
MIDLRTVVVVDPVTVPVTPVTVAAPNTVSVLAVRYW